MICPGTNRPPPMASELDGSLAELAGVPGAGRGEAPGGVVFRGGGASVSASAPAGSLPTMVGAVFKSTGSPHDEQNRPVEATCAPQEEQNMGRRDSTIPRHLA